MGIVGTLIIIFLFLQIDFNTKPITNIETKTIDPEQLCDDLLGMSFLSMPECIDFVNGMVLKINDYSEGINCKEHQLLFDKLGIKCT